MLRERIKKDIIRTIANSKLQIVNSEVEIVRTSDTKFGDYTTNVALRLAVLAQGKMLGAKSKQSAMDFANILADSLKDLPYVEKLEVAGPGFLNFFIKKEVWQKQVKEVLDSGEKFGSNSLGKGKKAMVEFVSANPTGPLHFGNARGGPIGDSLANILEYCGYKVIREYYHNDIGGQVEKLGQSILNVAAGRPLGEQEYKGEYIREFAHKIATQIREKMRPTGITNVSLDLERITGKEAVEKLLSEIIADCKAMGIEFDRVQAESELVTAGSTAEVLKTLGNKKVLKKQEGATWFAPKDEFLKDRECVVVKSDGSFTYFANDIAYHDLKFKDNPALVIDVWGANHHGHVPRVKAAISVLEHDVAKFHVILYQWVRFKRGKEVVKMSKRAGTFVTAREVLDEVGRDALRFFILMHDPNSHIDFDLALAKKKSQENPVYYVQYAHARICSILAKAGPAARHPRPTSSPALAAFISQKSISAFAQEELTREGLAAGARRGSPTRVTRYELLRTNYELDLIKQITRLPELIEDIATSFAVHRLTAYATELADSFHRFYENCRVIPASPDEGASRGGREKEDLTQARIGLILATKIVLANTLYLLGISAPEKM